jgi:deltex
VKYRGTRRHAYLPDTPEGREVLALLVKAFERRHSFLVGTSVTTGQNNVVVWSVHHKTNTHGGSSSFGYPDPTYFNRVKHELADRGVTLSS